MRFRISVVSLILWSGAVLWLIYMADAGRARWFFSRIGETPGADKLGHFVLYGGVSFFANLVAKARPLQLLGRRWLKWTVILIAVAALEEFSQLLFRWRSFDFFDLAAGAAGIWCFGLLAKWVVARQSARSDC